MVAYNFKPRFVQPILCGIKTQTLRGPRKSGHADHGDKMQLYCGMRTKNCRKIRDAKCRRIVPVSLFVEPSYIGIQPFDTGLLDAIDRNHFARRDGFEDAEDMRDFWLAEFGRGLFELALIEWYP